MQYSPKLKVAAEEIKEILAKHDIAGLVVLHTPGNAEFICQITPTYSCAWVSGDRLRFRALKKDYNTLAEWKQKVSDTTNMLRLLSDTSAEQILGLIQAADHIDKITGAEHDTGGFTTPTTQNN